MIVETDHLIKISSLGRIIGKSAAWIHKLIESDELTRVIIDSVAFVITDSKYEEILNRYEAK